MCEGLIEELQALVDDWSEAPNYDTEMMRASGFWMKYEAENIAFAKCAKKLKKVLAKYKTNEQQTKTS